jgi:hypothetical protein
VVSILVEGGLVRALGAYPAGADLPYTYPIATLYLPCTYPVATLY